MSSTLGVLIVPLIVVALAACSLGYQLLSCATLAATTGWTVWSQVAGMTAFLVALGVGSLLAARIKGTKVISTLVTAELALSLLGALAAPALLALYCAIKLYAHDPRMDEFLATEQSRSRMAWIGLSVPTLVGLFSGFELPLLLRIAGWPAGAVLAANYAGALLGAMAFAYFVQPRLDPVTTGAALALVNWFCVAMLALLLRRSGDQGERIDDRLSARHWAAYCAIGIGILALINIAPSGYELYLKVRYSRGIHALSLRDGVKFIRRAVLEQVVVSHSRSGYQSFDFVWRPGMAEPELYLDGHVQLHPGWAARYHESLVHLPIQYFRKIPRRALVLGGGDGVALRELLKYGPRLEHVTLVELDSKMIELARGDDYFKRLNGKSLDDPKVEVHVEDALTYLRHRPSGEPRFDSIYLDFPLPYDFDLLKLFSVEMYSLCARNLAPGGFIAFDAAMLDAEAAAKPRPAEIEGRFKRWRLILSSTLAAAGFKQVIAYQGSEGFITARLESLGPPSSQLTDFGIELKALDADFLRHSLELPALPEPDPAFVNSIFRPQLHSLPDFQF